MGGTLEQGVGLLKFIAAEVLSYDERAAFCHLPKQESQPADQQQERREPK